MKRLLTVALLAAAALAALACTTSSGSLFEDAAETESRQAAPASGARESGPVDEAAEPVQAAEDEDQWEQAYYEEAERRAATGLEIQSDPDGAAVYLDNTYVGTTPIVLTRIARGRYRLTLMKEGYYPASTWITHLGDYSVYSLSLTRITGFLRVEVQPPDALVTVGPDSYQPGRVAELPVGRYTVRARSFGYEERRETVLIRERMLTELSMNLPVAAFRASDLRVNRERFNPMNPGALGAVRVGFEVSSFGAGTAVVLDESGEEVHRSSFPRFTTWNQELVWDGRRPAGQAVPDGLYTVRLRAVGEREGTVVERETMVRVDSSLVLAYRSLFSGSAGLLYAPTPEVLPGGSFQLSSLVMAYWESDGGGTVVRVPAALAGRWGLSGRSSAGDHGTVPFSRWELDLQAGSIVGYASALGEESVVFPLFASAALKGLLLSPAGPLGLRAALQAKLAYQGVSTDTLANSTGLSLGAPAALQLGPVAVLLSPEIILSPWRVSYVPEADRTAGFYSWLYARAGILVDLGVVTAGLSASVRTTPFGEGFALDLPFQGAAELHWLIPRSPLFLSFVFAGEFTPPAGYYLQGGAGLGLLQ